jgi:hypothetical protein
MSTDKDFQQLIQYRNAYKRLSQVTWSIRASEERYKLGDPSQEEQLLKIYKALTIDIADILNDLKK